MGISANMGGVVGSFRGEGAVGEAEEVPCGDVMH